MIKMNVEVITPAVAAEYLKHNDRNRKLNKGQVSFYARMMQEGRWELNGEAIKFAPDGRLLDGQHRLMACVESATPFETVVCRHVDERVFDTFDQGWGRQRGQVFTLANIPNGTNIAAAVNKYIVMGQSRITSLGAARARFEGKRVSTRESLEEYQSDAAYWQNLYKVAYAMYKRCPLLSLSNTIAIMAHLNKRCGHDLGYVIEFFNQLFYDECTRLGVIRLLRQRLIKDLYSVVKLTAQVRTQLLRKAWDCYKAGTSPSVIKWTKGVEEEKPFE